MRLIERFRGVSVVGLGVWYAFMLGTVALAQETVFSASWGDKPGQAGLINRVEQERIGPVSFCVNGDESFVLDNVHKRILRAKAGKGAEALGRDIEGSAIAVDGTGSIWVQQGAEVVRLDSQGNRVQSVAMKKKGKGSGADVEGYGVELVRDGQGRISRRGLDQEMEVVGGESAATASAASSSKAAGLNYRIKRMDGNEVRLLGLDGGGEPKVSIPVRLDSGTAGAALFKGADAQGNLYVEIERIAGSRAEFEVHRYSPKGERLRVYALPNDYFTTVYKKTEIGPDGSVYQLRTTPDGVRVVRYSGEVK